MIFTPTLVLPFCPHHKKYEYVNPTGFSHVDYHYDQFIVILFLETGIIEKQAEDLLPSGGGMNAVPTAIELEAK